MNRSSPCVVRKSSAPYKDGKGHGNRLSAGPRGQPRPSPRVTNGDKGKPQRGKEKKENPSKPKDDKVRIHFASLSAIWTRPIVSSNCSHSQYLLKGSDYTVLTIFTILTCDTGFLHQSKQLRKSLKTLKHGTCFLCTLDYKHLGFVQRLKQQ